MTTIPENEVWKVLSNWGKGDVILLEGAFKDLMSVAINTLDDIPPKLMEIVTGTYEYPLSDFLYFSAITITTVGYGDILPNSSYVRSLVMIEALAGTVVIGAFISSLFLKPRVPSPANDRGQQLNVVKRPRKKKR